MAIGSWSSAATMSSSGIRSNASISADRRPAGIWPARARCRSVSSSHSTSFRPALPGAITADPGVVHDAKQPCAKVGALAIELEPLEPAQHRFLNEVFCVVLRGGQPSRTAVELVYERHRLLDEALCVVRVGRACVSWHRRSSSLAGSYIDKQNMNRPGATEYSAIAIRFT